MLDLATWKQDGEYIRYNGHKIFVIESGKGDDLILLHGFPSSSWDWSWIWKELAIDYHLISMDFIGFGLSDKPRTYNYSLVDQANLVEHIATLKNIRSAHILAHDYGDSVAQELLARFNDGQLGFEIKSVCLLNGGLFPGVHRPRLIQKLLMGPLGSILQRFIGKRQLTSNFKAIFGKYTQPSPAELDIFWDLVKINNGKLVMHKLIRYMQERVVNKQRWLNCLQQASVPIRLINGSVDPISGDHLADHYVRVIPEPDVVRLTNIGHYPQVESPQEVLKHYIEFAKGI